MSASLLKAFSFFITVILTTLFLCTGVCCSTTFASGPKLWYPCSLSHRSPSENDQWIQHPSQPRQAWVDLWCASGSWETKSTSRLLRYHSLQSCLQAALWHSSSTCLAQSKRQSNSLALWYTKTQFSWHPESTQSAAKRPDLWQAPNSEAHRGLSLCSSTPRGTPQPTSQWTPQWSYTPRVQGRLKQCSWTRKGASAANEELPGLYVFSWPSRKWGVTTAGGRWAR